MHQNQSVIITQKLKGKKISMKNIEQGQPKTCQIIILDYKLSENAQSNVNLGIMRNVISDQIKIDELVAIKIIHNKKKKQNVQAFQQFKKKYHEHINILCQVSKHKESEHSNIVQVYPVSLISERKTHAYMIMEFCQGDNLEKELNIRKLHGQWFTPGQFASLVKQVLDGYEKLYSRGILHQNIKPSSIFIKDGYLKIGNFDYSTKLTQPPHNIKTFGNPYYTAPQKYTPAYTPTFSSDIYSLGILLYQIIFNKHPYCKSKSSDDIFSSKVVGAHYTTRKKLEERIVEETMNSVIDQDDQKFIYCGDGLEGKYLEKVVRVVRRMIVRRVDGRIKFQELKYEMTRQPFIKLQPITFKNKRSIPKRLNYVIQQQSCVNNHKIQYQPLQIQDIRKSCLPSIYSIMYSTQKINIMTNFLYGVIRKLQMQIQSMKVEYEQISRTARMLLQFNFTLTFRKYAGISEEIVCLDDKQLKQFYSNNLDSLVHNTRKNLQFLQSQLQQHNYSPQKLEKLVNKKQQNSFKQIRIFFQKQIINNKQMFLDTQNKNSFLIIDFVIKAINQLGVQYTLQQIEKAVKDMNKLFNNLQKFTMSQAIQILSRSNIAFAIISLPFDD